MSEGNRTHTTSAAHQGYIERPSATEKIDVQLERRIEHVRMPAVRDGVLHSAFSYPDRVVDRGRASFGTIGVSKSERKEFWNDIERSEGKAARIQNRIIAELPHELSRDERCLSAVGFCTVFEERGLPYWAVIHEPGPRNDNRNFHLHITYYDRPTGKSESGEWSHLATQIRVKKSRHKVETRPYRSRKLGEVRSREWPKMLRRHYADICNYHLAQAGVAKRYDPRSYRDSGVLKEPTEHLGSKISAIETMGIDTTPGSRNTQREMRWIVSQAENPWVERVRLTLASNRFCEGLSEIQQVDMAELAEKGITHARKSASFDIISRMMTSRAEERMAFLDKEADRLARKKDISDLADRSAVLIALTTERDILERRMPALQDVRTKCLIARDREAGKSHSLMLQFDRKMSFIDPSLVLPLSDLEQIDNVFEPARTTDAKSPERTGDVRLDSTEFETIGMLFPELEQGIQDDLGKRQDQTHEGEKMNTKLKAPQKTPVMRLADIITMAAGTFEDADDPHKKEPRAGDFPGAWSIQYPQDKSGLVKIDKALMELDNRSLRQAAIASRDAFDLVPPGSDRDDFARGWAVLQHEAKRRGLDLNTGKIKPEEAADPQRARLHTDEELCPINLVRKNVVEQRVRF